LLKTILIGLDGSPASAAAIDLGVAWAQRFDSLLVGLAVIDEPTIRGAHARNRIPPSYRQAYDMQMDEERRHAEQILGQFATRCGDAGVAYKELTEEGRPGEQFLLEAERYDLIMLGRQTHFRAGAHQQPCNTLADILRATPRPVVVATKPVLTTKLHAPEPEAPSQGVLIAYDGSRQAARALQLFSASGLSHLGDVHIATVHTASSLDAAKTAHRAVEFLSFHDIPAESHRIVAEENVATAILKKAEALNVGLLVMGSHGHSKIEEFFIGSVTESVLARSPIPVFLFH